MTAGPLTALVVDDQPENIGVLVDVLGRASFRVLVADDGESALATAARVTPDVAFLDIMLPGIDGYETCRRLLADPRCHDVPVLFISALGDTADRLRGFAAGGVDHITKPFRAEEVLSRARAYASVTALRRRSARACALLDEGDVVGARRLLSSPL